MIDIQLPTPKRPGHLDTFMLVYREHLRTHYLANRELYAWPMEDFECVLGKVKNAVSRGVFNWGSWAMKETCRSLGLRHTRTAIVAFVRRGERITPVKVTRREVITHAYAD